MTIDLVNEEVAGENGNRSPSRLEVDQEFCVLKPVKIENTAQKGHDKSHPNNKMKQCELYRVPENLIEEIFKHIDI